jgi:hypothetical protein
MVTPLFVSNFGMSLSNSPKIASPQYLAFQVFRGCLLSRFA